MRYDGRLEDLGSMFVRYWIHSIAIAGWLALAAVVAHAQSVQEQPITQPSLPKSQVETQTNSEPQLNPIEDILKRIAIAIEAQGNKPEEPEEQERARRDLDAQEEMARWTFWMFFAATVSTILTLAGIFLIWRTLVQTRRAADAAYEMVVEAQKSTEAAENTLTVTHETGERQLRAYVFPIVDEIRFKNFDTNLSFHVPIRNSGQTPAYDARMWVAVTEAAFPINIELVRQGDPRTSVQTIAPGGRIFGNVLLRPPQIPISEDKKAAFRNGTRAIYLYGEITYTDAFNAPRATRFRYMCGGPTGVHSDGTLTTCEEGNESN